MRQAITIITVGVSLAACGDNPVEVAVRQTLIDPEAGEFRDVERCQGDRDVWRGEVNGKNRMGAFTGFEPFFFDGVSVAYAADTQFMALMERCYSNLPGGPLGKETSGDVGETTPKETGGWHTSEDTNPVDDSKKITATLVADEGQSSRGEPVSLVVRCESNKPEMYVVWNDYLGDDSHDVYNEWKNVTIRVGTEQAREERWDISTDKQATFAPGSPVALLKRMAAVDRLVLQTTPYSESPVTAVFELKGIRQTISPLAKECGWLL